MQNVKFIPSSNDPVQYDAKRTYKAQSGQIYTITRLSPPQLEGPDRASRHLKYPGPQLPLWSLKGQSRLVERRETWRTWMRRRKTS